MTETILYLDTDSGGFIQAASLAGIRRFAQSLSWKVVRVTSGESSPDRLRALFAAHSPDLARLYIPLDPP